MRKSILASLAALLAAPTLLAAEPVNQMCPIGKEPIVPSAGTVEYKGKSIGLCCPGCGKQFLAWDEPRKDKFLTLAAAHREPGQEHAAHHADQADNKSDAAAGTSPGPSYPYTLDTCPVSGAKLGSMGDPIVKTYDNREVRFCCASCINTFEADKAAHWQKIDEKIVDQQLIHYPFNTCIATGMPLGEDTINHVHNNRLVRLADENALEAFKADAKRLLEVFDAKIIAIQKKNYPMENCPIGGPLGSMGEPVDYVYMNRLVRFCCASCKPKFEANPADSIAKLDKAYADRQRTDYPLDTCAVSGAKLGSMGDPVEFVAGTKLVRLCCDSCIPKLTESPRAYLDTIKKP